MRQLRDSVWQVRGTSWVWDEEARNQICVAARCGACASFARQRAMAR